MKTKILKSLMFVLLTVGASRAIAQSSLSEVLIPGLCSEMSKNPSCWKEQGPSKQPRPTMCNSKSSCEEIRAVRMDSLGHYYCEGQSGADFSCHTLVEQFGTNLEGFMVKVTVPYVDGCHVLGGCGPKACVPSYGAASLDQFCQ